MARSRYLEAAKVAVILANSEQVKGERLLQTASARHPTQSNERNALCCIGNYRQAHDVLYNTVCELRNNRLKVSNEMMANLSLLHSYILVRVYVRLNNHSKAAPLLVRVSENIDRFPARKYVCVCVYIYT